jgi:hypothetical protein
MVKDLVTAGVSLMLAGYVAAADTPAVEGGQSGAKAQTMQADAMKLCDRLAGTEREICVKQAQENQRAADPRGAGPMPGMPGAAPGQPASPPSGSGGRSP